MTGLQEKIVSILKKSPADQYAIYWQAGDVKMSDLLKAITELQRQKKIHVASHRKNTRTSLAIPVYSLSRNRRKTLDIDSLLAGVTSERLVEYDFVAKNLTSRKKARILDVGSAESDLVEAISRFGKGKWDAIGTDILQSDSVSFLMDARKMGFRDAVFDQIICISTIEHIWIPSHVYSIKKSDQNGDAKAVSEIYRILKNGGTTIVTIPYGKAQKAGHRVYKREELAKLISNFSIVKKEFYRYRSGKWKKCSQAAADKVNEPTPIHLHSSVCACLLLKK